MSDQPTDRSRVDDLLGAFALDAVEPEERELVERHLTVDPDARAEVDAMRETASVLASIPRGSHDAPDGLWDRIAAAIETDDEDAERPAIEPIPMRARERAGRGAGRPTRRPRRRGGRAHEPDRIAPSVPMKVFAPIVAAAAIVLAVLGVQVANRPPNRTGNVAAAYEYAVAHGAATIPLDAGTNGPVAAEIALRADGTGYLRNEHLGALPPGRTYQLWALVGTGAAQRAISAGVLGPDPQAVAFHVASAPDAFAITVERAPGVVRSTQQPAAAGEVRT